LRREEDNFKMKEVLTKAHNTLMQVVNLNDGTYLIYERDNSRPRARVSREDSDWNNPDATLADILIKGDELDRNLIRKLNNFLMGY